MFDQLPRRRPLAPRRITLLLLIGLMSWSGGVVYLWNNETRLVFQSRRSRFPPPVPGDGLLTLTTPDGLALDAVALRYDGAPRYWILFCPPSAGTIHGRVRPQLESLRASGYNVFAFDYRGFGRNRGTPSEAGVYQDALTAYRYLTHQLDVEPRRVILAGRSLGSAVAIELATQVESGGLLLLSAIDSVPATGARFYPWAPVALLASQRFDSMSKAERVRVPVVQVHATDDRMVPLEVSRALFQRFPGRKRMLVLPGGHNDVGFEEGDALERALATFWMTDPER
jgi:uncharacterized protein